MRVMLGTGKMMRQLSRRASKRLQHAADMRMSRIICFHMHYFSPRLLHILTTPLNIIGSGRGFIAHRPDELAVKASGECTSEHFMAGSHMDKSAVLKSLVSF